VTLPTAPRAIVGRWAERLLFVAGGLCLGLAVLGWAEAAVFQWALDWRLERALKEGAGAAAPSSPGGEDAATAAVPDGWAEAAPYEQVRPASVSESRPAPATDDGPPIGRLVAPRLGLSAVVAEGISSRTLRRAVGHVPGTALPWEDGNVGLAAHRDTFFWRLKNVRIGDTLRMVTPHGRFEYVVRSLDVVPPERGDLLQRGESPRLTLVTCYPFSVIGPAPSRFVVTADRVDTAAAPPAAPSPAAVWTPVSQHP
jgi:sortase A